MLVNKHCHFHTFRKTELAYDSIESRRLLHHRNPCLSASCSQRYICHPEAITALCQNTSHDAILNVALLIEGFVNNIRKINTLFPSGHRQYAWCPEMWRNTGIHLSWIIPGRNSSCNIQIDFFSLLRSLYRTSLAELISPCTWFTSANRIAHMMVNADGFRRSEIIRRYCQTVRAAYIWVQKDHIHGITCFIMYLVHACNMSEYRLRLLQIDISALILRIPFLYYTEVKCHAGTYTVTIPGANTVPPIPMVFYAIQNFFDSLPFLHLDFLLFSSSSFCCILFSPSSLSGVLRMVVFDPRHQ